MDSGSRPGFDNSDFVGSEWIRVFGAHIYLERSTVLKSDRVNYITEIDFTANGSQLFLTPDIVEGDFTYSQFNSKRLVLSSTVKYITPKEDFIHPSLRKRIGLNKVKRCALRHHNCATGLINDGRYDNNGRCVHIVNSSYYIARFSVLPYADTKYIGFHGRYFDKIAVLNRSTMSGCGFTELQYIQLKDIPALSLIHEDARKELKDFANSDHCMSDSVKLWLETYGVL